MSVLPTVVAPIRHSVVVSYRQCPVELTCTAQFGVEVVGRDVLHQLQPPWPINRVQLGLKLFSFLVNGGGKRLSLLSCVTDISFGLRYICFSLSPSL